MNFRALLLVAVLLSMPNAFAQPAAPAPSASAPPVVALIAAVGDHFEVVRQRQAVGSNIEPFARKQVPLQTQALNYAALRGLDQAVADAEPDAKRVLVQWAMPEATADSLTKSRNGRRHEDIVLNALLADLHAMPARQQWDRIEAVVPAYFYGQVSGMGTKLSGIGVYVQPLANQNITLNNDTGDVTISSNPADGDFKTVDPNTGATAKSSVFLAPYMYFERITIDAKTLAVISRKRMFENTKYFDPTSTAIDVSQQMPFEQIMAKLEETVEHAAYKSVRDVRNEVNVTAPVPLPQSATPAASEPAR